jgi:carboxylesterase type B
VPTQQGDVIGTLVSPTVRQFLGIPFATANRWEAPKPPLSRRDAFQADHFGDSCIQMNGPAQINFFNMTGIAFFNVTESEDCLSVNIWAPSVDRNQQTAVMIWIYGGGFLLGTVSSLFMFLTMATTSLIARF